MNKIFKIALAVTLLSLTALTSNAFAFNFPKIEDYAKIFMVADKGIKNEQTDPFAWNQKPWLFLKLEKGSNSDTSGSSWTGSLWTWDNLSGDDTSYLKISDSTKNNMWVSFSDAKWEAIRQPGDWNIHSGTVLFPSEGGLPKLYYGSASFSVLPAAPEPISSVLFLTGGLVFAGRSLRKKRATV